MSARWIFVLVFLGCYGLGCSLAWLLWMFRELWPEEPRRPGICPSCDEKWDGVACECCGFAKHRLDRTQERLPRYEGEGKEAA